MYFDNPKAYGETERDGFVLFLAMSIIMKNTKDAELKINLLPDGL